MDLRGNWRVIFLVIVLLASTFALFSPTVAPDDGAGGAASEGPTNIQFGLELSGGTRIRAPLVGVTAAEVQWGGTQERVVAQDVAGRLQGADVTDVYVRPTNQQGTTGTVEVTAEGVSTEELASALNAAGYEHGEVSQGVTEATRTETVRVLQNKINEAGLSGGTVQQVTTATNEHFILIEVPNQNRSDIVDLVEDRGTVRIRAYHPTENGTYVNETVLTQGDFQNIGAAQEGQQGQRPYVPVVVRESVAPDLQETLVRTGVAGQGGTTCTYFENRNGTEPCLLVVVDGNVVNAFGMSPGLAADMRSGDWANDPQFTLQTRNFSEAQSVAINLRAGALPAQLDLSAGTSSSISASQGASFKFDSLLTGIISVLAVSGVVFLRYNEVRVAAPMIVTALSEVVILLGFAAAIGYPLDLSVIAGFIAVIGTGVDDLIIIADEVMAEGDVRSRRR